MLQLFPATQVYLPVSSVVTSKITKEPLGIFWNLEDGEEEVLLSETQEKRFGRVKKG